MTATKNHPDFLIELVKVYNRNCATNVVMKSVSGVVWSIVTFAVIFIFGYITAEFFGAGSYTVHMAALITGIYIAASFWSARRGVNPLFQLPPLTREGRFNQGIFLFEFPFVIRLSERTITMLLFTLASCDS